MIVGHKYRLYPSATQQEHLAVFSGARRFVFNLALEQRELGYKLTGQSIRYTNQAKQLKALRDDPDLAGWLKDVPAQILQQALRDLDTAFTRFFRGQGRYPKYKRKGAHESFRVPQHVSVRKLNRKWSEVKLPRVGWVKYRDSRAFNGTIKHATVSLKAGMWYVALQVEVEDIHAPANGGNAVGVDMGVTHTMTTSDGVFFDLPRSSVKENERLLRLQRNVARQKKNSVNQKKTRAQIAKIHARRARARMDFAHKATSILTKKHGMIAIEALKTRNMTRSARGTIENPGTNVKQKAGLNRSILESGWGIIETQLQYKTGWYGSKLIKTPAQYTSLRCNECGYVAKENRENQATFHCKQCSHTINADLNAARNILEQAMKNIVPAAGLAVAACEDQSLDRSVKQEPLQATV